MTNERRRTGPPPRPPAAAGSGRSAAEGLLILGRTLTFLHEALEDAAGNADADPGATLAWLLILAHPSIRVADWGDGRGFEAESTRVTRRPSVDVPGPPSGRREMNVPAGSGLSALGVLAWMLDGFDAFPGLFEVAPATPRAVAAGFAEPAGPLPAEFGPAVLVTAAAGCPELEPWRVWPGDESRPPSYADPDVRPGDVEIWQWRHEDRTRSRDRPAPAGWPVGVPHFVDALGELPPVTFAERERRDPGVMASIVAEQRPETWAAEPAEAEAGDVKLRRLRHLGELDAAAGWGRGEAARRLADDPAAFAEAARDHFSACVVSIAPGGLAAAAGWLAELEPDRLLADAEREVRVIERAGWAGRPARRVVPHESAARRVPASAAEPAAPPSGAGEPAASPPPAPEPAFPLDEVAKAVLDRTPSTVRKWMKTDTATGGRPCPVRLPRGGATRNRVVVIEDRLEPIEAMRFRAYLAEVGVAPATVD